MDKVSVIAERTYSSRMRSTSSLNTQVLSPNALRLSGERKRVRCSRGFGESLLMSRDMLERYAGAGMPFNGPELALAGNR